MNSTHGCAARKAFALFSLAGLVKDGLALPERLHQKLDVPCRKLPDVLNSLSQEERAALKETISKSASERALASPLHAHELCEFIDGIGD